MRRQVPSFIGVVVIAASAFLGGSVLLNPTSLVKLRSMSMLLFQPATAEITSAELVQTAMLQNLMPPSVGMVEVPPAAGPADSAISYGLLPQVELIKKTVALKSAPKKRSAPTPAGLVLPPAPVTAQALLKATTIGFRTLPVGAYSLMLSSKPNAGPDLTWTLLQDRIGGTGTVPVFATAYSCSPMPSPPPGAIDKEPAFAVRTTYDCALSLTPTSGLDQRAQTQNFIFTTPAGQLLISPPHSMATVLQNEANHGGFVLENQDSEPIVLNSLTMDVSFEALNISDRPLVLRVFDPITDLPLSDQHLENASPVPGQAFSYRQTGIQIPLHFTVKPLSQKMLPLDLLGVHTMSLSGRDPKFTLTLRAVNDKVLAAPVQLSWTCVVPFGAYDPNATSGPFVTGQACQ